MKTTCFPRPLLVLLLALVLAALAGCGSGDVRPAAGEIAAEGPFGMIIEAYKNNDFIVDGGGVVAAPDLDGHLAYLQDQNRIPQKVLLEGSSESKIRGSHLREFARLQSKYGFQAYVEHKGKIEPLHPDD